MNTDEDNPTRVFADVRDHVPFLARHESLARLLEGLLGYPKIRKAFADSASEKNPFGGVARRLDLRIAIRDLEELLPESGPVVVVANHSHGGADALAIMAALCELRSDVRVLANQEVGALPGAAPYLFPVTLMAPGSAAGNAGSIRAMLKHVRSGGCLGVFPAGRVAYWQGDRMAEVPWNDHVVTLLQRMKATIIPLYFFGSPPPAVNFFSKLSAFVRTALIPTGAAYMAGRTIRARAGQPFSSSDLTAAGDGAAALLQGRLKALRDSGN